MSGKNLVAMRALFAALAFGSAVATVACTVLSGVDAMELRKPAGTSADGGGSEEASAPDASNDPAGKDATSASEPDANVNAPCATEAACQEERCRSDLPDSRIAGQVGSTLGVTATCTASAPVIVSPGPNHYYSADVRCTLVPQPTPAAVSSFVSEMNADGWYGYSTTREGADLVVVGQSTTRLCNTY